MGTSAFFGYQTHDLKKEISTITEMGNIHVEVGMMQDVDKSLSLELPVSGEYYLDTDRIDELNSWLDGHKAMYKWKYTLNFGYEFTDNWNWCIESDQENRTVTVNVPIVSELNINYVDIDRSSINGAWSDSLSDKADIYAKSIINGKLNVMRGAYLGDENIINATNNNFSSYLQNILNQFHKGHNPISKVILINGICES